MTNRELIDLLMARLGERTAPALRVQAVLTLNEAIRTLEQETVLPAFMQDYFTGATGVGEDFIRLPSDFVREVEDAPPKIYDRNGQAWYKLIKTTIGKLEIETGSEVGIPMGYALVGYNMVLGPVPLADAIHDYRILYNKRTVEILDEPVAVTNPWILEFQEYTTFYALDLLAKHHVQSVELMKRISPTLTRARERFWRAVEAREHVNMNYNQE